MDWCRKLNPVKMKLLKIGWGRLILGLLTAWLVVLLLVSGPFFLPPEPDQQMEKRLNKALFDLDLLKKQNVELQSLLEILSKKGGKEDDKDALVKELQAKLEKTREILDPPKLLANEHGLPVHKDGEPSAQYEMTRRRIGNDIKELWYYLSNELKNIQKQIQPAAPGVAAKITEVMEEATNRKRVLVADVDSIADVDGYAEWREKEAEDLSSLVQRRLHFLQNPTDCSTARKLTCNLNKGCGYGCQIHHVVYCFIVAYGTQRTLILKSKGWRYHKPGWEEVFKPVSDTCTDVQGTRHDVWPGRENTQVVSLPIIDSVAPRPPYLPLAVPRDLAPRLMRLHGDPIVWWIGQFLKYLLRPQQGTQHLLDDMTKKLGFKKPIVGVHVRRTDKVGTEAAFHPLEEYMSFVEEFYKELELKEHVEKRRIYLASDDPTVIEEAKRKYPSYEILGDPSIARTAAVSSRYSDSSLKGIIVDIHLLSLSDYLVCTFSSQVCRIAYEIMQNFHVDAAHRFRSLDDIYYYGGQNAHNQQAVHAHKSRQHEEMDLQKGDLVGVAGNHWDGYSKGRNLRTNRIGLYPSYKVINKVDIVDFPTYPKVPLVEKADQ